MPPEPETPNGDRKRLVSSPESENGVSFGPGKRLANPLLDRVKMLDSLDSVSQVSDSAFSMEEGDISLVNADGNLLTGSKESRATFWTPIKENFFVVLSGLYGIFLVVLGSVVPIAEGFVTRQPNSPPHLFVAFYLYLYVGCIVFLIYVYLFVLREKSLGIKRLKDSVKDSVKETVARHTHHSRLRHSASEAKKVGFDINDETSSVFSGSTIAKQKKAKFDETTNQHTGSFYLRLGAVAFGIGSLIHNGLLFAEYFESHNMPVHCADPAHAVKRFFRLVFIFIQLYFIFQNSKMCVHKNKILARFGLMHMTATNICVWFRSIVVETLHVLHENHELNPETKHASLQVAQGILHLSKAHTNHVIAENLSQHHGEGHTTHYGEGDLGLLPELACHWSELMGTVLKTASPYLYPFDIEYSLICAGITYVMWENVGKGPRRIRLLTRSISAISNVSDESKRKKMSVDCAHSTRGLFLGILLFVCAVISLIAFYVIIKKEKFSVSASLLGHLTEIIIYTFSMIATVMAALRMRYMRFNVQQKDPLEDNLIVLSVVGLYIFAIFSIIAGLFHLESLDGILTVTTSLFMLVQSSLQTVFILGAMRLSAATKTQAVTKPGREFVTFLLLCNFAMWGINTFETQIPEHNPVQVQFYSHSAWAIFVHISVPLGIFYRFHSTVCLSHVWKNGWKLKYR